MMRIEGKTALVTGASRGIGMAIAKQLVEQGVCVVGTATTQSGADKITAELQACGVDEQHRGIVLNITEADSIAALDIVPDILINNAGITADNLALRMKEEEWCAVIDTNLTGIFRLTKKCLRPMLKQRWGRIINISSVVAYTGNSGQVNYSAAKAGMIGLTKSLALEVATRGITVNAVAPGFIATDMTKSLSDVQQRELLAKIPIGRMGTVQDVAFAVGFLASEAANYMTGETLHVNGGMLMN